MKKIVGAKEHVCSMCGNTMFYIKVKGIGIVSQSKRGNCISGRAKDEVVIYCVDKEGKSANKRFDYRIRET